MPYVDIPIEKLDKQWADNKEQLAADPKDWDAIRLEVLLENEYQRRGWKTPDKRNS